MSDSEKKQGKYIYVEDQDGKQYVCRYEDLKSINELSEAEKENCMQITGDG